MFGRICGKGSNDKVNVCTYCGALQKEGNVVTPTAMTMEVLGKICL